MGLLSMVDGWLADRRAARRAEWERERTGYAAREMAHDERIMARYEAAFPMTPTRYRDWYLVYHEGRALGTGTEPDRKNCGCFAKLACASTCRADRRRFEREFARRKAEAAAGRMTEVEVRGVTPAKAADWVDELAGRS